MVHVVSCRFLRVDCSEDEHPLFRREYARSNRERGVKLLRCFPHCCPEHAKRSYCGCSVHLLVTFSAEVSAAESEGLIVCTRFEPSRVAPLWSESLANLFRSVGAAGDDDRVRHENERKLRGGEAVQLPASLFELGARPNGKGAVWVRAVKESASMQCAFPKNTVLYAINKSGYPKWFYNYDSSTTRTQREMTHHLVAYVFRQDQSEAQDADRHPATVLARHPSPAFHVVSFRRIGSSSNHTGCELQAGDTDADDASSKLPAAQHQGQQQRHVDYADHELLRAGDVASLLHQVAHTREIEYREKGLQLLVLWQFLRSVSLADVEINGSGVGAYLMRAARASSGAELERVAAIFLSDVFERTDRDESPGPISGSTSATRSAQASPAHEQALIQVVAHLFLRAASSCSVKRLLRSANTTSKEKLRDQFTSLVSALYDVLDEMLRESVRNTNDLTAENQDASMSALVDAILSLVYTRDRFVAIRPEVSALLGYHQSPESLKNSLEDMFQSYTAQVREFVTSSAAESPKVTLNQHSAFCGRWVLDPLSIQVEDLSLDQVQCVIQSFRVTDAAQFFGEVGCIDVDFNTTSSTTTPRLSLLSALSFTDDDVETRTSMLLDGRLRVFRALPSGVSSMIPTTGGWSIGDYVGTLADDAQTLSIDLFAFAEGCHPKTGGEITVVRRVSMTLVLEPNLSATRPSSAEGRSEGLFLMVHGVVYGSVLRPSNPAHVRISTHRLSTATSAERAAVWSELRWIPLIGMQAEFVGLAFVRK